MPRCCQFSEDRKEPSAGLMGLRGPHLPASRSATDKLGDTARSEKWRNPGGKKGSHPFLGANSLGHHGRVRGPFPHGRRSSVTAPCGNAPSSLHRIYPKELARDMREFFNTRRRAAGSTGACHKRLDRIFRRRWLKNYLARLSRGPSAKSNLADSSMGSKSARSSSGCGRASSLRRACLTGELNFVSLRECKTRFRANDRKD